MDKIRNRITIFAAFFAFMSALSSLMLTRTLNRLVILKNEEVVLKAQVMDQWNWYQSKNIRIETLEIIRALKGTIPKELEDKQNDLTSRRDEIQKQARNLEEQDKNLKEMTTKISAMIPTFSLAVAIFQIALMVMPIAMLRGSNRFFKFGFGFGLVGIALLATGLLKYF